MISSRVFKKIFNEKYFIILNDKFFLKMHASLTATNKNKLHTKIQICGRLKFCEIGHFLENFLLFVFLNECMFVLRKKTLMVKQWKKFVQNFFNSELTSCISLLMSVFCLKQFFFIQNVRWFILKAMVQEVTILQWVSCISDAAMDVTFCVLLPWN